MKFIKKDDDKAAKKRAIAKEERVSLIAKDGKPQPAPSQRKKSGSKGDEWTCSRLMRYMGLTVLSAVITFLVLRKENQVLHWEEVHYLLEPEGTKQQRCYQVDRDGRDKRCTCPDPKRPEPKSADLWKKHHHDMVQDARRAPKDLDLVFIGDSITERWNGTRSWGTESIPGMRKAFEARFTKKGGGTFEAIALGSAGDTGPNLLWHLKNGIMEPLDPKAWFIHIGTNDLFTSKCTDRFVIANILNVLKLIQEAKPKAQFFIHGILPRLDAVNENNVNNKRFLGRQWQRAQAINAELKKFCRKYAHIHYIQGGPLFMEETSTRGRRQIDIKKMDDGVHPTTEGLEVWGDYLVKQITNTFDRTKEELKKAEKDAKEQT